MSPQQSHGTTLGDWIHAFRLRTLPLAAASILTGAAVAFHTTEGAGLTLVFALLTAFLLQVLSNLANDYGDSLHGADSDDRVGPLRAVQSGRISMTLMKRAIWICALCAIISGSVLLWLAFGRYGRWPEFGVLYAIGILAIGAAYSYTASKKPYGYRGWGDLAVFIFFGLVGVAGSHYLLTGSFSFDILLPSAWMGLQSCAVLNLNNLRDHESDARSGKHTLVVQWGYDTGKRYHAVLIFTPVVLMLVWFARTGEAVGYAMPAIWLMVSWVHYRRVRRTREARALDPELKFIALSSFLCALLFFILAEV